MATGKMSFSRNPRNLILAKYFKWGFLAKNTSLENYNNILKIFSRKLVLAKINNTIQK